MKSTCTSSDYGQNMCKVLKKNGIKLYEELCSRGTHCLYIEGEKWQVHNVEKSEKKKRSNNYIQSTCTSSYHEENAQEVPTVYI